MLNRQQHSNKILIVIPVYNEGEILLRVIASILSKTSYPIIIVDDGSGEILKEKSQNF